ncbi:leucine-rich repeat protein [Leucobacter insecticola]|uniref:Leucine-rich repeat protein n=1 Tax=Leucobacter insecticola TaxID=2714934 RepID=A0A6G8FJ06_9MICO|nr:leucine-rich repeat domain-containing protein [Leucobacter insecticola]QIM16344.1 leucine-rich repeat protein [Leucobacter insecticola]
MAQRRQALLGLVACGAVVISMVGGAAAVADPLVPLAGELTIGTNQLCPGTTIPGVSHGAGDQLTVDLAAVAQASGADRVVVSTQAAESCRLNLESVSFVNPGPVVSLNIAEYAFELAYPATGPKLTSVSFPEGLSELTIGRQAFRQIINGDNSLKTLVFPNSLDSLVIGYSAFEQRSKGGMNALTELVFPQTHMRNLDIELSGFQQYVSDSDGSNTLAVVKFPPSLDSLNLGSWSFGQQVIEGPGSTALVDVDIPSGIESLTIGSRAFHQSTNDGATTLASVTFPEGLKYLQVDDSAFFTSARESSHLTSLVFPAGLETLKLGYGAFAQSSTNGRTTLETISFPDGLQNLTVGGAAFYQMAGNGSTSLKSIEFPRGLTTLSIGTYGVNQDARNGSNVLESVVFPEGLKSLDIGYGAFYQQANRGSNALATVVFPETLEDLVLERSAFQQSVLSGGTNALSSVDLPDGLKNASIRESAFYQYSVGGPNPLTRVSLPGGMTSLSIERLAFSQFPSSLKVLEFRATETPATSIVFPADNPIAPADAAWLWYGVDGANTGTDWGATGRAYDLAGYRQLALEGIDDATVVSRQSDTVFSATGDSFAYPSTLGSFAEPRVLADTPVLPFTEWGVVVPNAERVDHTLVGWCTDPLVDGKCPDGSDLISVTGAVSELALLDPLTTVYAVWESASEPAPDVDPPGNGVTPKPGAPGAGGNGELSRTGADSVVAATITMLVLATGGALLLLRRRRV